MAVKMYQEPVFYHHGAVDGVTGSCHQYQLSDDYGVLIDCGLFQGDEKGNRDAGADRLQINFPLASIRALLITHVHIDHCGRIPYLLAAGFRGPIYCTQASALLLPLVIEDALKVGVTRDEQLIATCLRLLKQQMIAVPYNQWMLLPSNTNTKTEADAPQFRFQVAGHILGSAYVEIRHRLANRWFKTVFSGDLGAPYTPLLPSPKAPFSADIVVIESTYGDRLHLKRKQRRQQLQRMLSKALQDNGSVLIPAFSIGRTQELLYELEEIIHHMRDQQINQQLKWQDLSIIVDSPLAAAFNQVYQQLQPFWDAEAKRKVKQGRHPLDFSQLITIETHQQHLWMVNHLASTKKPAIVIAASGMCAGGRIVNYLKAMLGDPVHQVLFVGYQAKGTPGAALLQPGVKQLWLDGQRYPVQAEILQISGFSAHADQQDLLRFISGMRHKPRLVKILHGDELAKSTLKTKLQQAGVQAEIATAEPTTKPATTKPPAT